MITEPQENLDVYTVPSYSYMKPESKRASVALWNLSEKTQTFKKGTVIASIRAENLIPPKLAPKYMNKNSNNNNENPLTTSEHMDKLFSKLDIKGSESWDANSQTKLK